MSESNQDYMAKTVETLARRRHPLISQYTKLAMTAALVEARKDVEAVEPQIRADERKRVRAGVSAQMDWPAASHAFTDAFDVVFPKASNSETEGAHGG